MNEYIVRLWVDVKIFAENPRAARNKANKSPLSEMDIYDCQIADMWERGGKTISQSEWWLPRVERKNDL